MRQLMIVDIEKSKSRIMEAIVSCHNPYLLQQVERIIQRNKDLQPLEQIRRQFSIPMIVIAFLIIPVLLIEWKFYEEVSAYS